MRRCLAALIGITCLAVPPVHVGAQAADDPLARIDQVIGETAEAQSAFAELLDRHAQAMQDTAQAFAANTVLLDYSEQSGELNKQISLVWQNGVFRQDYRWIGFHEVFGYDGADHWYGSSINLPYLLDSGQGVDVTPQLVGYFAYLQPEMQQYLAPMEIELPLELHEDYAMALFSPPEMSQAVLLIDPLSFELDGMLYGNFKVFEQASLFKMTLYDKWQDFGLCRYPAEIITRTMSTGGEVIREKVQQTVSVDSVEPLAGDEFSRVSAPAVPEAVLPDTPYEIPFSFLDDNVVVRARGADGQRLRLEIDTGANVGLLRGDTASDLGLEPVGEEHVTGHGGTSIVQYARVEGVVLEGLNSDYSVALPPWPAAVITGNQRFEDSLREKDISGLLGNFVLSNFVVKLDYRRRRMTLYDPGEFDPALHLGPDAYSLPVTRDSLPYVDVVVDGKIRGGAFFNTGAQQYFTLAAWAAEAAGIEYDILEIGTGMTINGLTIFGLIDPEEVKLDGLTIHPAEHTHLELLAPGEAPNPNRIASFGNGFFRHHIVTFDLFGGFYYIEEM